jgi:hypothetical protein
MVAGLSKEPAVKLHLTTTRRRLTSMRAIRSPRWLAPRALAVAGLALVFGATLGLSGNSAEASGVWDLVSTTAPSQATVGQTLTVEVVVHNGGAGSLGLVDVELYSPSGTKIDQQYWDWVWLNGDKTRAFNASLTVPGGSAAGTYTVKVGFFGGGWSSFLAWHNEAAQVEVVDGPGAWELTETNAPATAAPGDALPVAITVENTGANSLGLVDLELYDSAGQLIAQRAWDEVAIAAGDSLVLAHEFTLAGDAPTGDYIVKVGFFGAGWGPLVTWYNGAVTIAVATAPPPPPPPALPLLGLLDDEVIVHNASEIPGLGGDGSRAGLELASTGEVGGLGAVTVVVSAAWDWSTHTAVHPCALVEIAPRIFPVDIATHFDPTPWTATATVTVTTAGGSVTGAVAGGSVCEVEAVGSGDPEDTGFLLEGIVSFEVTGGSGDFAGASGTGHTRLIANSVTREITGHELLLRLD